MVIYKLKFINKKMKKHIINKMSSRNQMHINSCNYCKTCYNEVIKETKKVTDENIRKSLLKLWKLLWINGCNDFDIIRESFKVGKVVK